jgi:hypothetical protein
MDEAHSALGPLGLVQSARPVQAAGAEGSLPQPRRLVAVPLSRPVTSTKTAADIRPTGNVTTAGCTARPKSVPDIRSLAPPAGNTEVMACTRSAGASRTSAASIHSARRSRVLLRSLYQVNAQCCCRERVSPCSIMTAPQHSDLDVVYVGLSAPRHTRFGSPHRYDLGRSRCGHSRGPIHEQRRGRVAS